MKIKLSHIWILGVVVLNRLYKFVSGEPVSVENIYCNSNVITDSNVCLPLASTYTQCIYETPLNCCNFEEELETIPKLRVIKNVKSLREARVIVYPESHFDIEDHQLQVEIRTILRQLHRKARHTILIEGVSMKETFPCHEYVRCTYPEQDGFLASGEAVAMPASIRDPKHDKNSRDEVSFSQDDILCGKLYNKNRVGIFYKSTIDNKFLCAGWDSPDFDVPNALKNIQRKEDNIKLLRLLRSEFVKVYELMYSPQHTINNANGIAEIPKQLILPILNNMQVMLEKSPDKLPAYLQKMKELLQKRDKIIKKNGPMFFLEKLGTFGKKMNDKIQETISLESEFTMIRERNKAMIKALKKSNKNQGMTFITMGRDHLIPRDKSMLNQFKSLKDVQSGDSQYELAQYLQSVPHAIMLKKDA